MRAFMTNNCIEIPSKIEDILSNFNTAFSTALTKIKDKIDIESGILEITSFFKEIISKLKAKTEALSLIIIELLKNEKIREAEETYIQYQSKLNELIQDLNAAIDKIKEANSSEDEDASQPEIPQYQLLFSNFIEDWKNQKNQFYALFSELEEKISTHLEDLIEKCEEEVHANISRLQSFYKTIREKLPSLEDCDSEPYSKNIQEVERLLKDIQNQTLLELNYQKVKLNALNSDLKLHLENLSVQWAKEIKNTEIAIQILLSPYKMKFEKVLIEQNLTTLESLKPETDKKIVEISILIDQKKFTEAEKALEDLEAQLNKNFEENSNTLEQIYQSPSPSLEDLIFKWKSRLSVIEKGFRDQISDCKEKIKTQHKDQLCNKVEQFIEQNLQALKVLIDQFKSDTMNMIKAHQKDPNFPVKKEYRTKKKQFKKEFDNKQSHIQLVFARYAEYSLDELQAQWNEQFKVIEDQFNAVQAALLNFMQYRDQINSILDKYYVMAQPAYGYKVPLKDLSQSMEMAPDELEDLFVNLISFNFISGEIDPVTKVIVLAPRVQKMAEQMPKQLRCMVCNLLINPSHEEVVHCPYCNQPAHQIHLIEWIKIKGKCPNCKREIKML